MGIQRDIDLEAISATQNVVIQHVGMREGNMRIVLRARGEGLGVFVIELGDVRSYYQPPRRRSPVLVKCFDVGMFGYWLPAKSYTQLEVSGKYDNATVVVAVARDVHFRLADSKGVDINYPV